MSNLTELMNRNGSDKGSGHHNYTDTYPIFLDKFRYKKFNLLEIGIGSNNTSILSNMSGTPGGYTPGSSLRGWSEYFPNAHIYGCDIDKDILFQKDHISTFWLDQTDSMSITNNIIKVDRTYDIIIDDGLHHFPTNWNLVKMIFGKLNPGGVYIIEDIVDFNFNLFDCNFRKDLLKSGSKCEYMKIPNPKNNCDNNIVVIQKSL